MFTILQRIANTLWNSLMLMTLGDPFGYPDSILENCNLCRGYANCNFCPNLHHLLKMWVQPAQGGDPMRSTQQTNQAWDRFKDRARDLKTQRGQDCACPPNDWTVNLSQKPTS